MHSLVGLAMLLVLSACSEVKKPDRSADAAKPERTTVVDEDPESSMNLREQLETYTEKEQWPEVIAVLEQLIEQEADPAKRGKYHYTIGVISRDEIGDQQAAFDAFEAALDANVTELRAFEAIDRILTDEENWIELERSYRRMLRRVAENDDGASEDLKVLLWQNLGEIYARRLNHIDSAIMAYEAALSIKPDDPKTQQILSALRERSE